jgi:stress-induced-phosphoprotein 1
MYHNQQLRMIQANPKLAETALGSDPRMIDVLGALMGLDMQGFSRPEGSDEGQPGFDQDPVDQAPGPSTSYTPKPSTPAPSATPKTETKSTSAPPPPVEEEEIDEDQLAEKEAKTSAEKEKAAGAAAYKSRDFATAVSHFSKAWDLWPKDITFLTNLGAAYFEQGEYQQAIEVCEKAVESGREVMVDS